MTPERDCTIVVAGANYAASSYKDFWFKPAVAPVAAFSTYEASVYRSFG